MNFVTLTLLLFDSGVCLLFNKGNELNLNIANRHSFEFQIKKKWPFELQEKLVFDTFLIKLTQCAKTASIGKNFSAAKPKK